MDKDKVGGAQVEHTSADSILASMVQVVTPKSVIELRILTRGGMLSGYFDDLKAMACEAARYSGSARGIYWTMNPCDPRLLERAANRVRNSIGKGEATSDSDILTRRFMLVDIDPVRLANTDATPEEHAEARALADHIRNTLTTELAFPEPVQFDSGNGAYLLYSIDLPNDQASTALVKGCLRALALHNRPGAHVDPSTSNSSRIMRVPGTLNCKGIATEERPHRLCTMTLMPARLECVPRAALERLAGLAPKAVPPGPGVASPSKIAASGAPAYARAALDSEVGKVRSAASGERNNVLNTASFALGQLVAGNLLSETDVYGELERAALQIGLDASEIKSTIQSGISAGMREPRSGPQIGKGQSIETHGDPQYTGLVCLADVVPEQVRWLWPGRIPLGKLTILDGDPGLGKSVMTTDLAARVSNGWAMPDGTLGDLQEPAGVILLSLEDGLADTIRPRLDAAGADVRRIAAREKVVELCADGTRTMRIPDLSDIYQIECDIARHSAKLAVIDPVMAYLPADTKSYTDHDVRRVLTPLAEMAERTGCAVLVLRHLNKATGGNPLYRGGGSIGFIGAARAGLLVGKDPDDSTGERRVLVVNKSNLGRDPGALAFHIEAGDNGHAIIVWDGPTGHTATSLLTASSPEDQSVLAEGIAFLEDLLHDGPCRASEVKKHAKDAGISDRTLNAGKQKLGIKPQKRGAITDGYWEWALPSND
ncbi:MAG TPA: AAA family ATPase [Chloroflexia bacterium]|nr:AAA family ATPase [Chloroflexia bacterium]